MNVRSCPEMRLADIVEFLDDMRRDLPVASRRPGPYPCFGGNGYQGTTDAYLFDEPLVLLAEDLSAYTQSGKPHALAIRGKAWVSRRIHVLRPGPRIVAEYLACALEDLDLTRYASGARRNRLTRARALDIRVPVPPLDAQREIAAALVQADALRERRRRTHSQLDAFVRVYFLEHFGDPQINPCRFPRLVVGALAEHQKTLHPPVGAARAGGNSPPHGAARVVGRGDEAHFEGERLLVAADGMNLVSRLEPISQVVVGELSVSGHAHVLAPNGRADPHYLHHALELTELRPYLTSATRPKLNRAALERISVPVPPLESQRAFRALVEKTRAVKALQQKSAERLDELYRALRLRALSPGQSN